MSNLYTAIELQEFNIQLPRPEDIPSAPIAAALTKFMAAHDRVNRVRGERDSASADLRNAIAQDTARGTEMNDNGEEDLDPLLLQRPAQEAVKTSLARVEPAVNARRIAYAELVGTIRANREDWQEAARGKVETALRKSAAALRTVELAREEYRAHLGVLELLAPEELRHLRSDWAVGAVEVDMAVASLGQAIGKVSAAVRAL